MYARICALLVACALAIPGLASAQERFGTFTGTVTDPQSWPVPGVTVDYDEYSDRRSPEFVTDANGQYYADDLDSGALHGSVRADRVCHGRARAISASLLGRTFQVDAQMRVGGVRRRSGHRRASPLVDTAQHADSTQRQRRGIRPIPERALVPVNRHRPPHRSTRAKSRAASR